jgi:5,10-methylenetetrahydromethanopterin reductase
MLLHRAADAALMGWPTIASIPPALAETIAGYVEVARQFRPQGAHYLENHRGHLMFVKPEERPFVTADLIRLTTFTATGAELTERIAALDAAGYDEIAIQIVPGQEHAIEDWGRIRRAFA